MDNKEYLDLSVHEIKNILSAISGYSEFITSGIVQGDRILELAERIKALSEILAVFADKKYMYDLLHNNLYKPEFESVLIYELLQNVKNDVAARVASPADCQISCSPEIEIYADRLLLRELLYAVMENASRYSLNREAAAISVQMLEEETVISIKNKSEKITEEEISKLMEPYFRVNKETSRKMGSQGFGLAIAAEVMEIHGGTMKIGYDKNYITVELHFHNIKG